MHFFLNSGNTKILLKKIVKVVRKSQKNCVRNFKISRQFLNIPGRNCHLIEKNKHKIKEISWNVKKNYQVNSFKNFQWNFQRNGTNQFPTVFFLYPNESEMIQEPHYYIIGSYNHRSQDAVEVLHQIQLV